MIVYSLGNCTTAAPIPLRPPDHGRYERLLEDVPDELIDELVAALEAEAARDPEIGAANPVQEVLREIGFARDAVGRVGFRCWVRGQRGTRPVRPDGEWRLMAAFIVPMLAGGAIAGAPCAAIGRGFAKLRDR